MVQIVIANQQQEEAHQLVGQAKRHATEILHKVVGGGIFDRFFSNFEKCRPEVADDVIDVIVILGGWVDFSTFYCILFSRFFTVDINNKFWSANRRSLAPRTERCN